MSANIHLNLLIAGHLRKIARKFDQDDDEEKSKAISYYSAAKKIENSDEIITSGEQAKTVITKGIGTSISSSIDKFLATFNNILASNLRDKISEKLMKEIRRSNTPITSVKIAEEKLRGIDSKSSKAIKKYIISGAETEEKSEAEIVKFFSSFYGIDTNMAQKYYNKGHRNMDDIFENEDTSQATKNDYIWKDNTEIKLDNNSMAVVAEKISELLEGQDLKFTGGYSLGLDEINEISFVIKVSSSASTMDEVLSKLSSILPKDGKLLQKGGHYFGIIKIGEYLGNYVDIKLVPETEFPTKVLFETGPKKFVELMIERAKKMGYELTEKGLFQEEDDEKIRIPLTDERDIFETLELLYIQPNKRNGTKKIGASDQIFLPTSGPDENSRTRPIASVGEEKILKPFLSGPGKGMKQKSAFDRDDLENKPKSPTRKSRSPERSKLGPKDRRTEGPEAGGSEGSEAIVPEIKYGSPKWSTWGVDIKRRSPKWSTWGEP